MVLTAADNSWQDQFYYPLLKEDQTAGRWPDGCDDVFVMNIPTIARPNLKTSYLTDVDQSNFTGIEDVMAESANSMSIVYSAGSLIINGQGSERMQVTIYNLAGQTVFSASTLLNGGYAEIPLYMLSEGVYVATVSNAKGHKTNCKFIK